MSYWEAACHFQQPILTLNPSAVSADSIRFTIRQVVALVETAQQLVAALATQAPETEWLAGVLAEHLLFWRDLSEQPPSERTLGGVERRRQFRRAQEWIEAHLHEPLRVTDLADALHLSTRSLLFCFRQEVGHSPLEGIRRQRFRRLHQLLRTPPPKPEGIEELLRQCGLSDSASTRRQYRQWCGETPAQSRALAGLSRDLGGLSPDRESDRNQA